MTSIVTKDANLVEVLQASLYPGARADSIGLVLGYCKAAGLDPMQKPVHIVPMRVKGARGDYEWRDTIMPGIGLYRTQAARTGQHAGTSEPEFGPAVSDKLGGAEVTYPEWCRVTVRRRLPSGEIAEYAAVERWLENYATAGRESAAPNAMWLRRPYAQLAKCAEAQALRRGFPEIGSAPTAEEMEGKWSDADEAAPPAPPAPTAPPELPAYPQGRFDAALPKWHERVAGGAAPANIIAMVATKYRLSEAQRATILALAATTNDEGATDETA